MKWLSVMIGYFCCIVIVCLCSCTTYTYNKDMQVCLTAYSEMQPGTTTEDQFLGWVKKASIYYDKIDGKKVKVYRCGWMFSSESKSERSTTRHYRIVCPSKAAEFGQPAPTTTLYRVTFRDGILDFLSSR